MNGSDFIELEEANEKQQRDSDEVQPEEETEMIRPSAESFKTIGSFRKWLEEDILMLTPFEKEKMQREVVDEDRRHRIFAQEMQKAFKKKIIKA